MQILSRFRHWKLQKRIPGYRKCKMTHACSKSHNGSAGPLEYKGGINIFSNSIEKYNLRHVQCIGDGETESNEKAVDAKLYGDFT